MIKRVLSLALAVLMMVTVLTFTTTPALAAGSPSFIVKYEKDFGEDGTLLFSEEPVQTLTGDEYYKKEAYVFPVGTKVALKSNGALVAVRTFWETPFSKGTLEYYTSEQNEITLRSEISNDAKGVRIVSTVGRERGLLTVFVSNTPIATTPPLSLSEGDFIVENGVLTQYLGAGYGLHVVVPDGVREIAENAFASHAGIVSVTLPDSVKTIHTYAFRDNTALTDVYIGSGAENITNIWAGYFNGCTALQNIHVSKNNRKFYDIDGILFGTLDDGTKNAILCRPIGKTGSTYVIPDGTAAIGSTAFSQNSSLVSITIADSVQGIIYTSAFYGNTSLEELNIGAGVRYIDAGPYIPLHMLFPRCTSLRNINVSERNITLYDIDGVLFTKGHIDYKNSLVYFPGGRSGTYVIPDGTDKIGYDAFMGANLTDITIPGSVKRIDARSLSGVSGLTRITIPEGVEEINGGPIPTISSSKELVEIVLPSSVNDIGKGAFRGNGDTREIVYVPAGSYAESYCKENNINYRVGSPEDYPDALNLDTAAEWARKGIQSAYSKGFVPRDLLDNYTDVITRAEFCRMAVNFVEYKTGKHIDIVLTDHSVTSQPGAFTDTNDPDILAAYALGITNGTGPNTFSPDGQFSREQAATMIRNVCKVLGMDVTNPSDQGFADISSASTWAIDGINFCRANGIMNGTSTTPLLFSPKSTYTRQESILTFNNIK